MVFLNLDAGSETLRIMSWMVERAEEELQALEALHPHRLGPIKLELMNFIADSTPSISPISTQESSSNQKKKRRRRFGVAGDGALERAEECLKKIRRLKEILAAGKEINPNE